MWIGDKMDLKILEKQKNKLGFSFIDLEKKLRMNGVKAHASTIFSWVKGTRKPYFLNMVALCGALNITIHTDLYGKIYLVAQDDAT